MIEYSRNIKDFAINNYTGNVKVPLRKGYYIKMESAENARVLDLSSVIWNPGADRPNYNGLSDRFEFKQYETVRHNISWPVDMLGVQQAAWDVAAQYSRMIGQELMTYRSATVANVLTTTANWGGNTSSATSLAGGLWRRATSTNPYIKVSILKALTQIEIATNAVVDASKLMIVMNPNLASAVAESAEFIDFLKQQSNSLGIFQGDGQFGNTYGLGGSLYGLPVYIERTVKVTSERGATRSAQYVLPDDAAFILSRPDAIVPAGGPSFNTVSMIFYEEMTTEADQDTWNRRLTLSCTDDYVPVMTAPETGYFISDCT